MSNLTQLATIENLGVQSAVSKLVEIYRESLQITDAPANLATPSTLVTLYLKSGLSMRGTVISQSADGRSALLLIADPNRPDPTDVTYVLIDEIAGLSIHGAMAVIEHLSDGKIIRQQGATPSLPDLSRAMKTMVDDINLVIEGKMTAEISGVHSAPPEALQALQIGIRDLGAVLKQMANQELSRQALGAKGFQFKFMIGNEAKIRFNNAECQISIGMANGKVDRLSRESLRMNLEESL